MTYATDEAVLKEALKASPLVSRIPAVAEDRMVFLGSDALAALLLLVVVASLIFGVRAVPLDDALAALTGGTATTEQAAAGARLPRTVLGLLAGMSLAVAGGTMQAVTRNPLADPGIFGVLSGASLVAAIGTAVVIYALSYKGGFAGTRLILIGIGVSSMLGAVVTYTLAQASAWDLQVATRWLTGSLNGAGWPRVLPLAVACAVVLPLMWAQASKLAAMRFGDDTASGLGVKVFSVRIWTIVAAVTLVAVATASCGPVAFVAFMSGPIAARIGRSASSLVLPASLVGAILVLVSDLVGQFAFGTRYPVGIITGALGAPFLVYLLIRSNRQRRN